MYHVNNLGFFRDIADENSFELETSNFQDRLEVILGRRVPIFVALTWFKVLFKAPKYRDFGCFYIIIYNSSGKSDRGDAESPKSGRSPDFGAWSGRSPDHALNFISVLKYDWNSLHNVRHTKNQFKSDRFYEKLWNLPELLYIIM